MEQLIERVNKLSTAIKAAIIFGIITAVTGGTWFFLISDLYDRIDGLKAEQVEKEKTLAQKQEIADNLNDRRRELDKLEAEFQEWLTQLPERKDIEELLSQLNDVGRKSGLEIRTFTPQAEVQEGFYSRIPIAMSVTGNYHEIAMFLQEIAHLPRIVNVSGLKLGGGTARGDRVYLSSDFTATAFRFSDAKGGK